MNIYKLYFQNSILFNALPVSLCACDNPFLPFLFVLNSWEESHFSGLTLLKCVRGYSLFNIPHSYNSVGLCVYALSAQCHSCQPELYKVLDGHCECDKASAGVLGPVTQTNIWRLTWVGAKLPETMSSYSLTRIPENINIYLVVKAKC